MLGTKELLRLVGEIGLVEGLSERELTNPEGSGFDLRVGEVHGIMGGEAFLGESDRRTPETELLARYGVHKDYILRPGGYVLVKTIERVNLPKNMNLLIKPRSTLQRCGVLLPNGSFSPGYSGEFNFGLYNAGKNDFRFELGARIAHVYFFMTGENHSSYRGQWQGGRVSTDGVTERQV